MKLLTIAIFCTLVFLSTMLLYLIYTEIKRCVNYLINKNRYK